MITLEQIGLTFNDATNRLEGGILDKPALLEDLTKVRGGRVTLPTNDGGPLEKMATGDELRARHR